MKNNWTIEEIKILIDNANFGIVILEKMLNRTRRAIYKKANCCNLSIKKVMSDVTKNKISISMKLAHKELRHNGWSFINSDINRRSYPEIFLISVLEENKVFNEYTVKEKFKIGKYYIDFLIVELKLIIEMDGQQHFSNEKSIKHDLIRDDYFINLGFKIYRIKWIDMFNNTRKEINELMEFIRNINNMVIRKYTIDDYVSKNICSCGVLISKKSKKCSTCYHIDNRKVIRPDYKILIDEINNLGYVGVGRKYNVSDNAVRKWLKYY